MPVDLKPYLRALSEAIVKPAPPWPKAARDFMAANATGLLGWYNGHDDDGRALIYLNLRDPKHRDPQELLHTASEELCHHVDNPLNDAAVKARAVGLLGYSRWRAAVAERLLALVLSGRK